MDGSVSSWDNCIYHYTCGLNLIIVWGQASLSMGCFNVFLSCIFFIVFLGLYFTLFRLYISVLSRFMSRFRNRGLHHVFEWL